VTLADEDRQSRLRTAAVDWVVRVTNDGAEPVTRDQLVNDFLFEGERFPLVDAGRGIRKPAGWDAALTIMTAAAKPGRSRPYDDDEGPDGLHRYKLRRDQRGTAGNRVMRAYETRCAVCSLGHRQLLDAAHVIPDSHPDGAPVVPNGLALCKIHHAAYDRNILGIRPDYVVEIHHRLLDEIDGPMLKYGLQEHHGLRLRQIPRGRADRPDPERLEVRYTQFRSA
jgi:hypothetical protein